MVKSCYNCKHLDRVREGFAKEPICELGRLNWDNSSLRRLDIGDTCKNFLTK